jgi:O-acetyl-ADP-ribose deacetylase (regulator of RNase III)
MTKQNLVTKLLDILTEYLKIDAVYGKDFDSDYRLFRGLCNQTLTLDGIDDNFYVLQDQLLKIMCEEKGVVDVQSLPNKNNICLWQGDITRLNADAIVNAANDQYLGCFVPCHSCIDNIIMSASGFQMRNELLAQKSQKDYAEQKVKVTSGYNLPCKFVFHVAGPQIFDRVHASDKIALAGCYTNCLDKAKELGLKSIAFCCISTGVYSFPNDEACKIAVESVKKWQKNNNFDILVIFNVYKDLDRYYYEQELSKQN